MPGVCSLSTLLASRPRRKARTWGPARSTTHMWGDVEHAGVAAHGVVFLDLGAVVDRHVPAAEVDHAGAEGAVDGIEGRGTERHGFLGDGSLRLRKRKRAIRRMARARRAANPLRRMTLCPRYLRDYRVARRNRALRAPSVDTLTVIHANDGGCRSPEYGVHRVHIARRSDQSMVPESFRVIPLRRREASRALPAGCAQCTGRPRFVNAPRPGGAGLTGPCGSGW